MSVKDEILEAVKCDKVIAKHTRTDTWISGGCTEVYPITLWPYEVSIQLDLNVTRNMFKKAIDRVMTKYSHLFKYGCFVMNDGSCPSEIRFYYTDETITKLKN